MSAKAWPPAPVDPEHVVATEPVQGSPVPVHLMYVEAVDGAYIPIALRKPEGAGPFPVVLFATGNGGGGMAMLRNHVATKSWSHGGEMALKIASEYHGFRAMVASEPASHEFVRLRPDETAKVDPKTGLLNVEKMLMRTPEKVRPRITEEVAKARVAPIDTPIFVQGRDSDELQGIFRVSYDLLHEAGKDAVWKSYDHHLHGFVYPEREPGGDYAPDAVQRQAVADTVAFFERYMRA
jgi:hypothetical protein